ncbi:hypothetical protein [Undibacterium sp.]|uniref:hypothetical protein n=1 Tax=Undibacterium sp. TaxID=1914977 RepID=UPI0027312825|nr:hypothetical protein [Undibacterium sp.]MDP1980511.1 hypothetical protein [Undibacterium sp.]
MSEKPKAKIFSFPKQKSDLTQVSQENAVFDELKAILLGDAQATTQEKTAELKSTGTNETAGVSPPGTVINNINIHGGNNQFAPGHLTVADEKNKPPSRRKADSARRCAANEIEVFADAINATQKLQLRKLRDEIVKVSTECGFPKHPASIMSALNSTMGVRKYDQIVASEFPIARAYLTTMKSVFSERLDFHRKREELRRYMIQVVTETHRKTQAAGAVGLLGALDTLAFSELEKMYDLIITDLI